MLKHYDVPSSYKPVSDYPRYAVNDAGIVLDLESNHPVSRFLVGGYYKVRLFSETGVSKRFSVHRLVAEAWVPKPEGDGLVVNHLDAVTRHNAASNLEWTTRAGNNAHAAEHGLSRSGLRTVVRCRYLASGKAIVFPSVAECARKLNLNRATVVRYLRDRLTSALAPGVQLKLGSDRSGWIDPVNAWKSKHGWAKEAVEARSILTGEVRSFESITEAARALKVPVMTAYSVLKGLSRKHPAGEWDLRGEGETWPAYSEDELTFFKARVLSGTTERRVTGVVATDTHTCERKVFLDVVAAAKGLGTTVGMVYWGLRKHKPIGDQSDKQRRYIVEHV